MIWHSSLIRIRSDDGENLLHWIAASVSLNIGTVWVNMQFLGLCQQFTPIRLCWPNVKEVLKQLADYYLPRISVAIRSKRNHVTTSTWLRHEWPGVRLHKNTSVIKTLSREPRLGYVLSFRNKFLLFQHSDWFSQDFKIHINPFTPKISILIHLTVSHTFHFITWV